MTCRILNPKTLAVITLSSLALFTVGCGNINRTEKLSSGVYGTSLEALDMSGESYVVGDYTCPAQPNVKPNYDWRFDGTGLFTVCKNSKSTYKTLIHGSSSGSDEVCVFPIEHTTDGKMRYKLDRVGAPLFECMPTSRGGVVADFNLTNYNAVIIVDAQDRPQMSSCLSASGTCPIYAHGKFR